MKHLFMISLTVTSLIWSSGCSDPLTGCTDPEAETYDPNAEKNNSSDCIYARDKFVGDYDAELECDNALAFLINGMTSISIVESSTGSNYVDITLLTDPILRLEATVEGYTLFIDNAIPNVSIGGNFFDVAAKGELTLDNNEKDLSGILNVTLTGPSGSTMDSCMVIASKK